MQHYWYKFVRMAYLKCGIAIILIVANMGAGAQPVRNSYPTNYFRNPVDLPILLAGNFGECRPGHFHSGIDIKTKGEENKVVRAAADGYISRIKTEKGGFGHALYITHPNGYTTLYAHLNNFAPAIQKYLRSQQYKRERWDLDLYLSPGQFSVKKGEQIAWSGNTGGSTAPHLHFEIRNTKTERPLNPQLFGLAVNDKTAPVIKEIALYNGNIYADITTMPRMVQMAKQGKIYTPTGKGTDTIIVPGTVSGIGVNCDDYMNGSDNTLTFYTAELWLDDSLQAMVVLDDIGYDESRYIHAYADYRIRQLKKKWLQCMFQLPGNKLNRIYKKLNDQRGRLAINDDHTHKAELTITDAAGNESRAVWYIKVDEAPPMKELLSGVEFAAGKINKHSDPNIEFVLDEQQLYDDIVFEMNKMPAADAYTDVYMLHKPEVPLHHYMELKMKPNRPVPFDLRSKMVMMYTDGHDTDGRNATSADGGWYTAQVRNFGSYWLQADTTAPEIKSHQKNGADLSKAKQISFTVKDALTSVKKFGGWIDEKWVCFEQHGRSFFYEFDEHCPKGKHELVFKAEDENGNERVEKLTFTR